ncbi:molybdopterin-guanine dinucleotide biosynthesis protein B [Paenibacillus sp. CF384]|uniref:molybdopterin-guanine dinucleotide biosynthesis protein B n=1 Tax=Paenibacillus sp. CF384 TaxID=1884382 RepID=UPI0008976913|nr:molybdopterin-guanine dinucleotide biosynthesis protein B [Paenibacillus sp. CF384]SDW48960.1 molybdopterin-guanine dinucleotide biosynthesis protein B [Paenibacillus sp. CF384]
MTSHSDTPSRSVPFVLQVVGYKNSGKTTMITALTKLFKQAGCTVGTAKHDAHDFTMDTPGTDTWRHQESGADITAISSSSRSAVISARPEPLSALLTHMQHVDIVLVEGFKQEHYPKLILLRSPEDESLLSLTNPIMTAVWPQAKALSLPSIPHYDINDIPAIYNHLLTLL